MLFGEWPMMAWGNRAGSHVCTKDRRPLDERRSDNSVSEDLFVEKVSTGTGYTCYDGGDTDGFTMVDVFPMPCSRLPLETRTQQTRLGPCNVTLAVQR